MFLADPVLFVAENVFAPAETTRAGSEPAVVVTKKQLCPDELFGGVMRRTGLANTVVPADNASEPKVNAAPGSGIVFPNGANIYYLDLAPGYTTPMHRTVSADVVIIQVGCPTMLTPSEHFSIVDGAGTYRSVQETVCRPGQVVLQRGQMHAWANTSDAWARVLCIVFDAQKQRLMTADAKDVKFLEETWLQ